VLEKLGEEHPNVATTYNNMAMVYWKQEDYPQALEHYGKCLKIQLEKLGEEHPHTKGTQEAIELLKRLFG
jgi:tetratricopeptide (TPR) repeat protein